VNWYTHVTMMTVPVQMSHYVSRYRIHTERRFTLNVYIMNSRGNSVIQYNVNNTKIISKLIGGFKNLEIVYVKH